MAAIDFKHLEWQRGGRFSNGSVGDGSPKQKRIKKDVADIIAQIKSSKLELDAVNTIINNIVFLSSKTVNELGYNIFDIVDNEFSLNFSIYEIADLIEMEEWLFGFFFRINEYISKNLRSRNELLISRVSDFLGTQTNLSRN